MLLLLMQLDGWMDGVLLFASWFLYSSHLCLPCSTHSSWLPSCCMCADSNYSFGWFTLNQAKFNRRRRRRINPSTFEWVSFGIYASYFVFARSSETKHASWNPLPCTYLVRVTELLHSRVDVAFFSMLAMQAWLWTRPTNDARSHECLFTTPLTEILNKGHWYFYGRKKTTKKQLNHIPAPTTSIIQGYGGWEILNLLLSQFK